MATITKTELKKIIDNRPSNITPEQIVFSLQQKGHSLEGFGEEEKKEEPKKGLLERTTNIVNKIFPGGKVGESIGTLAGYGYTAAKEKLGLAPKGATANYDLSSPTPLQVAGDIGAGALTVAGAKGVGMGGTATQKILSSTAYGAGFGGSQAISEKQSVGDVVKSTALGAGLGAGLGVASVGVESVLNKVTALPERLVRSATGQSKKELLAGKDISKYVIENKKIGTAQKLIRDSQTAMDKANEIINTNLKSVPITKHKITNKSLVEGIVKQINEQGGDISAEEVKKILYTLAPQSKGLLNKKSMSLVNANKLRQSLDKTLGDRGFLTSQLPFNKDVLRTFTNALRETIKTKAPEGTRAAFNTLSKELTLYNALSNKVAQGSRNQIISFGDLFGAIPGGMVGGVPGVIAGAAARRAVQSTPFLTGSAVTIDTLNKAITPILNKIEPATRTLLLKAITDAIQTEESATAQ